MKSETQHNPNENIQKLENMIKGIKFAMLTTIDSDGALRSRPMACQEVEFDGDLWFFTNKTSGKIHSIVSDQQVNVTFVSPDDNRFVSISGRADIVDDRDKEKELWNPILKAWFPEGLDDPNLVLIRVEAEGAEYWDSPSSKVVQLVGFTKAILTGEASRPSKSEHQKISLRS